MYLDLLTILLLLGTLAPVSVFATPADPEPSVYMITTRGNLQSPVGLDGSGYHNLYQFQPISSLFQSCPSEIVIFIHGWGVGSEASKEQLDRVKMSLENSSYHFPLIGYSWGSDIDWNDAKILSIQEGAKLAHFISTYNQMCNSDDIISQVRLIGHSLGARVILSSLHNLSSQSSDNFNLLSVHLMGAAVDNEEVSMDPIDPYSNPSPWWWVAGCTVDTTGVKKAYGDAIQQKVINFYNLVNSRDNVLEFIYPCYEGGDRALGQDGKQDSPLINTHQIITI
ncbi:MAG: DUF726 domain-containing protein [Nitrososphaeraceae archaeon]